MKRCICGQLIDDTKEECSECARPSSCTVQSLVGLLRRVHAEIDALGEGIPMSADTWDEMEDILRANSIIYVNRDE